MAGSIFCCMLREGRQKRHLLFTYLSHLGNVMRRKSKEGNQNNYFCPSKITTMGLGQLGCEKDKSGTVYASSVLRGRERERESPVLKE